MINLPKHIEATGFDCLISCITMVCMYWRIKNNQRKWNLSYDLNSNDWDNFHKNGLSYVRNSGVPFNSIGRYLSNLKIPLKAAIEFLPDTFELENLIGLQIPPIVLYDRFFMLRGINRTPFHSVVLVDETKELFTAIDPSLSPKFLIGLPKKDFKEAWDITQNATVIITPKTYKSRRRNVPSVTLTRWVGPK